jgi:hypothetical protein
MPCHISPRTDSPQACQLIDLLKETGRLVGREVDNYPLGAKYRNGYTIVSHFGSGLVGR